MEIIGVTRVHDGKEVNEFVARCETHDYYYNGMPPLTTGCRECWNCYFFCQLALSEGDKYSNFQQLESAIRHTCEMADKGEWDFKPDFKIESIEKDVEIN